MRVVSGTARGMSLTTLEGLDTRPTTDRVKESIFNIIQFEIYGKRVLDLFAGSGALGIEALSRGAAHATFVDANRAACEVVRKNLAHTRLQDSATVLQTTYDGFLQSAKTPFDLVLLDPPYASDFAAEALKLLQQRGLLNADAVVVVEHDRPLDDPIFAAFHQKEYRYGKTFVTFLRNEGKDL